MFLTLLEMFKSDWRGSAVRQDMDRELPLRKHILNKNWDCMNVTQLYSWYCLRRFKPGRRYEDSYIPCWLTKIFPKDWIGSAESGEDPKAQRLDSCPVCMTWITPETVRHGLKPVADICFRIRDINARYAASYLHNIDLEVDETIAL